MFYIQKRAKLYHEAIRANYMAHDRRLGFQNRYHLSFHHFKNDELSNPPVITSFNGEVVEGHRVTIASDTEIDNSCSLMLNGQYYIFGGYMKNKQVRLRSKDSIPRIQFDF